MNLFLKISIISFPLVALLILFWPTVIKITNQLFFYGSTSTIPVTHTTVEKKKSILLNFESRQSQIPKEQVQPKGSIYRRVGEDGTISFSDRPVDASEQPHKLEQIGYVSVSEDIKQRIASDRIAVVKSNAKNYASEVKQVSRSMSQSTQNYKFSNTSAGQKHKYILLSGRITGGPACKELQVLAVAKSDGGRLVKGVDRVSTSGFGSSLFEMKIKSNWNGKGRRPQWELVDVSARCLAPS